jgi:hypothetical protein
VTAKAAKGKRIVGEGLVQKTRREEEQTRVWLHDALDASRPSDHTLNPFQPWTVSSIGCGPSDWVLLIRGTLRCGEAQGRACGCHCQERVVGPSVTWLSHVETRGWWYTSFLSGSHASWHGAGCMVHGIWRLACKVLRSWALLYFW